ncbi:MAG: ATP phosphoribosyltransferase regulatory subunit [Chloroflexi bacterium]|nr:ATP phosphoribosyltransferase regulatory subunit [Chloroflexota bacterium]
MENQPIDKVRGMLDLLPDERRVQVAVGETLAAHIAAYGYRALDLPVLERTELYLRKVGQEMVAKLYAFRHHNRDLCLRPELTASVVRAYVAYYQNAGLPLRLAYAGPVFRYEAPGKGRYRQFTEVGVELLGAGLPAADAEVIHIAADGLERLGLRDYRVVIGHIGIAQAFLAGLTLDDRVRDWLTWSMEDLRQHDEEHLHHALDAVLPAANGAAPALDEALAAAGEVTGWGALPPDEAERVVLRVLRGAGFDLSGSRRTPEEIARRLVGKLTQRRGNADVERALGFLRRLARLRGAPDAVLADLRALLAEERLADDAVRQVEALLEDLDAYGLSRERITLDAGLGRGLHFYTGIIFEIYEGASQLAGGGRYDDLATVLGARERTPACGFAYGLERIVEVLQARGLTPTLPTDGPEVLVCAVSPAESAYAIRVAHTLRQRGRRVELDVRQRGVRANLETANRRAIPYVAIVGEAERRDATYVWRDMAARAEEQRALAGVALEQPS